MKRILVVDDEPDVQVFVGRVLSDSGYEVESAGDGNEALDQIAARRPDMVLLDLMMPRLDGWGVLQRLREAKDPPPVVVLTARGDYEAFARGVREGVAAFIGKPFHFGDLLATCRKVLDRTARRPAPATERRREPRRQFMVGVRVLSRDRRPLALGELVNISPSGAQVDLVAPIEVGERVKVALHISLADSPMKFEGQIQWRSERPHGFAHGLAFVDVSQETQSRLAELFRPPD